MGLIISILCFFLPFFNFCEEPATPSPTPAPTAAWEVGLIHLFSGEGNADDSIGGADGIVGSATGFKTGRKGLAFEFDGADASIVGPLGFNMNKANLPKMTSKYCFIVAIVLSPPLFLRGTSFFFPRSCFGTPKPVGMHVQLKSKPNPHGWVVSHDNGVFDRGLVLHDTRYGGGVAAGVGFLYTSTLPALNLNQWYCVAVAYDETASTANIFVDGDDRTVFEILLGNGLDTSYLGGNPSFPSEGIDGLVDEVFVYDRALIPLEMSAACAGVLQ